MDTDVQLAIEAEKTFNNRNLLLVTFTEEEINSNTFKQLHRSVKDVHVLQSDFFPGRRCIVEVKDLFDIYAVKDVIMKHNFENCRVQVKFLEKFNDSYMNIDPYKLIVKNLTSIITHRELKQLYSLSTNHTFLRLESKTRTALVHFGKVQDAIAAFKTTNFMQYQSNILSVKFYRTDCHSPSGRIQKKRSFTEDRDTDFWDSSDEDNVNNQTVRSNDLYYKESSSSDDDIVKWKQIKVNSLKDKKISDTLLVHNLPYNTTGQEIQKLFPSLYRYKFIPENKSKSCIVRFRKTEEALGMYAESNNVFKSNILQIEFYDKENDISFFKVNSFKKELNTDHDQVSSNEETEDNENTRRYQNMSRQEEQNDEVDRFVLHVRNLPLCTNNEDLLQLYPDVIRYEILSGKNENSTSAYVCFKTAEDTISAYNATKNTLYKSHILSVKFKSKKFKKLNPFALMKRNNSLISDHNKSKKVKLNTNIPQSNETEDNDVIVIDEVTNMNILNEDEVECKSEGDDYIDQDYYVDPDMDNGNENIIDEDDNDISEDLEDQAVELDDNNVLPLDEDYF